MSWAIGYDPHWGRDIGYGVPAYCDAPGCDAEIDRGLAYVCGGEPYGGRQRFDRPGWIKPAKGDRPPFGLCLLIWSSHERR